MKYVYRILTGQTTVHSKEIIMEVCTANYVDIVRGNITPDHMLISMSPGMALSRFVQYINGKSSHKLFQEFERLRKRKKRKRYFGQHLWQEDTFLLKLAM
ncbi:MAG: IS200/IS605 family transposase [Wolbachia sp.]|nr:IS200/IS605 family transposase [Wolbachia sp.]MDD9336370.1 IS200/IS605 family transposase [Wolbachia sp.]